MYANVFRNLALVLMFVRTEVERERSIWSKRFQGLPVYFFFKEMKRSYRKVLEYVSTHCFILSKRLTIEGASFEALSCWFGEYPLERGSNKGKRTGHKATARRTSSTAWYRGTWRAMSRTSKRRSQMVWRYIQCSLPLYLRLNQQFNRIFWKPQFVWHVWEFLHLPKPNEKRCNGPFRKLRKVMILQIVLHLS